MNLYIPHAFLLCSYEIMLTCWEGDPEERPDFKELESKLEGILVNMSVRPSLVVDDANYTIVLFVLYTL